MACLEINTWQGLQPSAWGRVTAGRFFERRMGACLESDGGDFCAAKTIIERSFQWWWRCFNRKPRAKVPTKAMSLWQLFQPLTAMGTPEF